MKAKFLVLGVLLLVAGLGSAQNTENLDDLHAHLSSFEDTRINCKELAFYLVTHGVDATPVGSYVKVVIGGKEFKLVPNGRNSGLAEIVPQDKPSGTFHLICQIFCVLLCRQFYEMRHE